LIQVHPEKNGCQNCDGVDWVVWSAGHSVTDVNDARHVIVVADGSHWRSVSGGQRGRPPGDQPQPSLQRRGAADISQSPITLQMLMSMTSLLLLLQQAARHWQRNKTKSTLMGKAHVNHFNYKSTSTTHLQRVTLSRNNNAEFDTH